MFMNIFRNIAWWYFSRRTLPYWVILAFDCLIVLFAGSLALVLTRGTINTI